MSGSQSINPYQSLPSGTTLGSMPITRLRSQQMQQLGLSENVVQPTLSHVSSGAQPNLDSLQASHSLADENHTTGANMLNVPVTRLRSRLQQNNPPGLPGSIVVQPMHAL